MSDLKIKNVAEIDRTAAKKAAAEAEVKKPKRLGDATFTARSLPPELNRSNDEKAFKEHLEKLRAERATEQKELDDAEEAELKEKYFAEREQLRAEHSSNDQEEFLEALHKAYNGDFNQSALNNIIILNYLVENYTPEDDWTRHQTGSAIAFLNTKTNNHVLISKEEIVFKGNTKKFQLEDAIGMVLLAKLDKDFQKEGFTIEGATPSQQALFEQAVELVNKDLPPEQQIKMHNEPVKPANWNLAKNTFGNVASAKRAAEAFRQDPKTPNTFASSTPGIMTGKLALAAEEKTETETETETDTDTDTETEVETETETEAEAEIPIQEASLESEKLLNLPIGDQNEKRGIWSQELINKFGEIQSITKAVADKFDQATDTEKKAFIDAGLIKSSDTGTEFNAGAVFGIAKDLDTSLTLEQRADSIRDTLSQQAKDLGITDDEVAVAQETNDKRKGMDTNKPHTKSMFIVPVQKSVDPNMGKMIDAIIPVHLAIRSGLTRQLSNTPDTTLANEAFQSNFEKGSWDNDPDEVKKVMAAGQRLNAIERGEAAGPIDPKDIKTLVDGLAYSQKTVETIANQITDPAQKEKVTKIATDIQNLHQEYTQHLPSNTVTNQTDIGISDKLKTALKEKIMTDFKASTDQQSQGRTVTRDKIADYLTAAGTESGKDDKVVDLAIAFLLKEKLIAQKTDDEKTVYTVTLPTSNL